MHPDKIQSEVSRLPHPINSPSESLDIINELMRWSSYYELHIHTVLHLNKGDDNTRGHIGTELNNKAETILQISKNNENGKISDVRAIDVYKRQGDTCLTLPIHIGFTMRMMPGARMNI